MPQNFILTELEKENISKHKYSVEDKSISTEYLKNFWNSLETLFPAYVSPNIISFCGLLIVLYGSSLLQNFYSDSPFFFGLCYILCVVIYFNLDAIDGIHARKTQNASPMGELVDHGCDSITTIFMCLSGCKILEINDPSSIWYITIAAVLGFQFAHQVALKKTYLYFNRYFGPTELIIYYCVIMLAKIVGLTYISYPISTFLQKNAETLCVISLVLNLLYANVRIRNMYPYTANGLSIVYIMYLIKLYLTSHIGTNLFNTLSDNLVLSVMSCDLMINKMAKKSLSYWIVIISFVSQISNVATVTMCILYLAFSLYEMSVYMDLPIITTNTNVYCCGVFDLCHVGHKKMFDNCLQFGNRLIVGVHSDAAVESYKRTPIMTHDERCVAVENCKHVSKVLRNANLIITDEDIDNNNIHIVVCSGEYYDDPNDTYYTVPRRRGILRRLPYSPEISTSDLINRVVSRASTIAPTTTPNPNTLQFVTDTVAPPVPVVKSETENTQNNNVTKITEQFIEDVLYDLDEDSE